MHLQFRQSEPYFAYINTRQLSFGKVLTYLCWSIKESTSQFLLSITLFDLDEGTGNCINVTVESPCPLVISNLISLDQRDITRDLDLENGTHMRILYDYVLKSWSSGVFPLQAAERPHSLSDLPVSSFHLALFFLWPQSLPLNKTSVNLFMIPICTQQKKHSEFHFSLDS